MLSLHCHVLLWDFSFHTYYWLSRCSDGTDILGNSGWSEMMIFITINNISIFMIIIIVTDHWPGISVKDKPGNYSLSDWERCPVGSAVCGIRFIMIIIINIIVIRILINRTRTQDGFTDAVSNLGQTEVVLHCCQLPTMQTSGASTSTGLVPEDASAPFPTTESSLLLSSSSSTLPATSTLDSSSLESSVAEKVDLVRTRTGAKIRELRKLLNETKQGSLYGALEDLVATLVNVSGIES